MPKGQRRSTIDKIQDEIQQAEKRREKSLDAAAREKKTIVRLQNEINKSYASEITKACRAKGYPLEKVLEWIKEQPDYDPGTEKASVAADGAKTQAAAKKTAPKKPTRRKPAAKKPRASASKKSAAAEPKAAAPNAPAADQNMQDAEN